MVRWKDVELHANEARMKGWKGVKQENVIGTAHVRHMVSDPEIHWISYWSYVRDKHG